MRAPKVYSADLDGLHEWIVAAPNQRAALDALGVHQDLFAQGRAAVETDPLKIEAARAEPGVPLRRAKGSKEAFEAAGGGSSWDAALKAAPRPAKTPVKPAKGSAKAKVSPAPEPAAPKAPRPDKAPVRAAEAALKAFEREAARTLSGIDDERAALDRRERQARSDINRRREALTRAINRARSAYEAAGGRG